MMGDKKIMAKWKEYLRGETYKVFDHTARGEGEIESLEKMIQGGQDAVYEIETELRDYNFEWTQSMLDNAISDFAKDLPKDEQIFIEEDWDFRGELRDEYEKHEDFNYETFYDYDILIIEKTYPVEYDGMETKIDWKDSQSVAFRKKALKHITKEELKTILINSYGGEGYIAAIVNGTELIEAIRSNKKTVGGNVVVGVHDWMNGAGMYEESKDYIDLKLENASIDSGDYGVGGTFGSANWKYS